MNTLRRWLLSMFFAADLERAHRIGFRDGVEHAEALERLRQEKVAVVKERLRRLGAQPMFHVVKGGKA